MKKSHTKTTIFTASAIGLLVLACCVLVGMWYVVNAKAATLTEALTSAATLAAEENQMANVSQLLDMSADNRELLKSFVLSDTEVIDFISHLEAVAQSRGLSITTRNVTTSALAESTLFETFNLDLELSGNKQGVMDFVSYIEQLPYQTAIPNITLERTSTIGNKWTATFEVHITKTIAHE